MYNTMFCTQALIEPGYEASSAAFFTIIAFCSGVYFPYWPLFLLLFESIAELTSELGKYSVVRYPTTKTTKFLPPPPLKNNRYTVYSSDRTGPTDQDIRTTYTLNTLRIRINCVGPI